MSDELAALTRDAVQWALIHNAVKAMAEAARAHLDAAMLAAGSERQAATNEHGTRMGTVSRTGGKPVAEIFDMDELINWTAKRRPTMLRYVLDPSWLALLKEITVKMGVAVDPETGEAIPGIRLSTSSPGLLVATTSDARRGARDLVARLATGDLMITEGGDDA